MNYSDQIAYFTDQVFHCMKCGACMAVCPTFKATGRESMVARGRLSLLEAVLDGEQVLTRELSDRISQCIGCRACEAVCPSGLDIVAALDAARADRAAASRSGAATRMAVRRALGGTEGLPSRGLRLAAALEQSLYDRSPGFGLLPYWRHGTKRTFPKMGAGTLMDRLPEVTRPDRRGGGAGPGHESRSDRRTGRIVFFPGCATNIFYPETGLSLARVLSTAGIEMVTPRGWRCCGLPFLSLGDRATALELADDNVRLLSRALSESHADAVVTVCSSCALAFRKDVPALLGGDREDARKLAARVMDIHEFLAGPDPAGVEPVERIMASMNPGARDRRNQTGLRDLANQDRADAEPARVTFHSPCHLHWGLGMENVPGRIISSIPGVDYIEAPNTGSCCGGGGLFSIKHYDLALKIGGGRADDLAATGADIVATGCPGCRAQLTDLLRRVGSEARVVHTVELLAGTVDVTGGEHAGSGV